MGDNMPAAAALVEELQQEGEPAGGSVADAENHDLVGRKDELPSPEKPRGRKLKVAIPFLALGLAMLLAAGSRPTVRQTQAQFLRLGDEDLQKYRDELAEAVEKMEETWQKYDLEVKGTFRRHFMPSASDDEAQRPEEPIEKLRAHLAQTREFKEPSISKVDKRIDYALHLRLLRFICLAVVDRLQEVGELQQDNKNFGVPVPIPGREKPYSLPTLEAVEGGAESQMRPEEFLQLLKIEASVSDEDLEKLPGVDKDLADKLVHLLAVEGKRVSHNISALSPLVGFLGAFNGPVTLCSSEEVNYFVPYTGKVFETFRFGKMFERMYPEFPITPYRTYERRVQRIARTWSAEVALEEATKLQEESFENWEASVRLKRKLMQEQMKKGTPADDLLMYCLFLL
ncbi:hypothetical protein, conserved [Eimeria brunetti]|uniref:Uncharacterized protein n=1 Tax=Eimeria brunetti TaxID=51314 RepID=U6LL24_9EIME|nr:hypothetical protein, conserved [Eimeria brunetti]